MLKGGMKLNSIKLAWRIRRDAIEMTHLSHASHIGSALSCADVLAVLYADVLHYDVHDAKWEDRDRLVLSKGHAGSALYAALAEVGFFPLEELKTYYQNGSRLSGHISHKGVPGVEFSTGSLGHGVCVATGLAMAGKLDRKQYRTYAIVGDGECDEGSLWETVLFANQFCLKNYTIIVDHNGLQSIGRCEDTIDLLDLGKKFQVFGWNVIEVDGHDHSQLKDAFSKRFQNEKPICIIANTVKGKGISFMENKVLWHYRDPQGEFYERAVKELEDSRP